WRRPPATPRIGRISALDSRRTVVEISRRGIRTAPSSGAHVPESGRRAIMKRKISALLAADIVRYSTLVAEAEEETGGRIVNMVGDAVLAEFGSSVDAVRCALDVQDTTRTRNQAYPDERHMQIRIGITLADIMD